MGKSRKRRRMQRKRKAKMAMKNRPPSEASFKMRSAIPLSGETEPIALLNSTDLENETPVNRQSRRKAERKEARASKRKRQMAHAFSGSLAPEAIEAQPETPPIEEGKQLNLPRPIGSDDYLLEEGTQNNSAAGLNKAPKNGKPDIASTTTGGLEALFASRTREQQSVNSPPDNAVISPLNRALADPNERMIPKLRRWMRSLISPNQPAAKATSTTLEKSNLDHLVGLRADLAIIQKRVDRMIKAAEN